MGTRRLLFALIASALAMGGCDAPDPAAPEVPGPALSQVPSGGPFWRFGGKDLADTRHAAAGTRIDGTNVATLAVSWVVTTGGDVSATPSVDAQAVYVPDWAGNLYSLDRRTGAVNWSRTMSELTGAPFSRTTPAIHGNRVIFGDQGGRAGIGASLVALDKSTGELQWSTKVDEHPLAVITQSPVVVRDMVLVGVSSIEETLAAAPGYPCCSFRGSVVALDVITGQIIWKTYMAPGIPGYSGAGVWGSTPAVDPSRGTVYVTTGNNYSVPDAVLDCVAANQGDSQAVSACLAPDDFFDAIVALDLETGAVLWATKTVPYDAWTSACLSGPTAENCPDPAGSNFDFGEGPALFTVTSPLGLPLDVVGAGQKSGQYWVLDRSTGLIQWVTSVGPGGTFGGMIWGSATDGERIYTANANSDRRNWGLVGGSFTEDGFWSALDARTGEILWQTPDPVSGSINQGPVAVANDVVFGCSMDPGGGMYALAAESGQILWSFSSGGSCNAGAAIVDGQVFWGSGYSALADQLGGTANNKLYAFGIQD